MHMLLIKEPSSELISTLSLHDALPISRRLEALHFARELHGTLHRVEPRDRPGTRATRDRKSTRLNSSHVSISYDVFCLKKKKKPAVSYFYIYFGFVVVILSKVIDSVLI